MPLDIQQYETYTSSLDKFITSPETGFYKLPASEQGIGINYFNEQFRLANNLTEEDMKSVSGESERILRSYKDNFDEARFIPKGDQLSQFYEPVPDVSGLSSLDDKISAFNDWKDKSYAKSSTMIPSQAEDFKVHLNSMRNELVRREAGQETGWMADKFYRGVEGFLRTGTDFADLDWARDFLAENLPENPEMDSDFMSSLSNGAGELTSQALFSLVTAATVGPQAVPYAVTALYSARGMKTGFDEEFLRSGNREMAFEAGVASIPGSALEGVADLLLFKGIKTATKARYSQRFLEAPTLEAKRQVLKEALPNLAYEMGKNGLSEATIGSIGADFTTGYGRYLATGDSAYIPSFEELMKGAAVEGILGAGFSGATTPFSRSGARQDISNLINADKRNELADALKSGNFDAAIKIISENGATSPVPQQAPAAAPAPSQQPQAPAANQQTAPTNQPPQQPVVQAQGNLGLRDAKVLENYAKSLDSAGNPTLASKVRDQVSAIRGKTYTPPASFDAPRFILDRASITAAPSPEIRENDVIMKDGTLLPKDKNIFFVNGITPAQIEAIAARQGGVSMNLSVDGDSASIITSNAKGEPVKSEPFQYSTRPRKGWIAIEAPVVNVTNESVVTQNFSIVPGGGVALYANRPKVTKPKADKAKKVAAAPAAAPAAAQASQQPANINTSIAAQAVDEEVSQDAQNAEAQADPNLSNENTDNFFNTLEQLQNNQISDHASLEENVSRSLNFASSYISSLPENSPERIEMESLMSSMIDMFDDYNQANLGPEPERWSMPGYSRPSRAQVRQFQQSEAEKARAEGFRTNQLGYFNGRLAEFNGERGLITVTSDGVYVGDTVVSPNAKINLTDVEGLRIVETQIGQVFPFVYSDGRRFNSEKRPDGTYFTFEDGQELKVFGRRGGALLNPQSQQQTAETFEEPAAPVQPQSRAQRRAARTAATREFTNRLNINDRFTSGGKNYQVFDGGAGVYFAEIDESGNQVGNHYSINIPKSYGSGRVIESVEILAEAASDNNITEFDVSINPLDEINLSEEQVASEAVSITSPVQVTEDNVAEVVAEIDSLASDPAMESVIQQAEEIVNSDNPTNEQMSEFHNNFVENAPEGTTISPPQLLDYVESTIDSSESTVMPESPDTFMSRIQEYIETLSGKARDLWSSKVAEIAAYRDSGFSSDSKGSLTDIQIRRINSIAGDLDPSVFAEYNRQGVSAMERSFLTKARQQDAELSKINLSAGRTTGAEGRLTMPEVREHIKSRGLPIRIINKPASNGIITRGATAFRKDGGIDVYINLQGIRDIAHLDNVINEELGHIIYNNPNLRPLIDRIANTTEINEALLNDAYMPSELLEESVAKRFADLIDQYNGQGSFGKLITQIKTYLKKVFGLELSDRELGFVAVKALNKSLADKGFWSRADSGTSEMTRSSQSATGTEINLSNLPIESLLKQALGGLSNKHMQILHKVGNMIRAKLEQNLVVDEPATYAALKSVNYQYLSEADLASYEVLLDNFINTRRSRKAPPDIDGEVRLSQSEVIDAVAGINKIALQGEFDFYQSIHPFLEGKDFANDFGSDMDVVKQKIKEMTALEPEEFDLDSSGRSQEDNYWDKIIPLQEIARQYGKDKLDEKFPSTNQTTDNINLSKHLGVFNHIAEQHMVNMRNYADQWLNSLINPQPGDAMSPKQTRKLYYNLMAFASDGYAVDIENFVSSQMSEALDTKVDDAKKVSPFSRKMGKDIIQNTSSFATNIRAMGNAVADVMFEIVTPFRAGLNAAERIQNEFVRPFLNEAIARAQKISGFAYNNVVLNQIGVYALGRAHKVSETALEGLLRNKRWLLSSIEKYKDKYDKGAAQAAIEQGAFVESLFQGISEDMDPAQAMATYEANASKLLDAGMIGYANDVRDMFAVTKDLSQFTTEFVYGRHFEEWINYVPAMAIQNDGHIEVPLEEIQSSSDDRALMETPGNINFVKSGLGSTKDRNRRLGDSKVLVFNINHMAESRMRINMLDHMTAIPRRELANVINGRGVAGAKFAEFLGDKNGKEGRVSHVQHAVRTLWNNSIQGASYISDFQSAANTVASMWSLFKMSSAYQLPAQFFSNTLPYFIVNAMNPQKISAFFEASNMILKYRAGKITDPRLNRVIEDVLSAIKSRSQDALLDRSVTLDVGKDGAWQIIKGTQFFNHLKTADKIRERVMSWQLRFADDLSGAPMLLAEYFSRERDAGRAVDWEGLKYNDRSFFGAVDEIERFIGIGSASRRGVWLSNKNGWMAMTRNMISAFSSHRINNATNFRNELSNITNINLSNEERIKSGLYMTSIIAQSAMFSAVKFAAMGAFYNLLTAKMGEEENEEELEENLRRLMLGGMSKESRKSVEAEIAMRKKIREEFRRVKDANSNAEVILASFLKDSISNALIIPAVSDIPLNAIIHLTWDKMEAESFKKIKESTLEDLDEKIRIARANGKIDEAIELKKDSLRWESQEAIQLTFEKRGMVPFDGTYGGVLNDAYKFTDKASGILFEGKSMTLADFFLGAGILGIGQADITRAANLYAKRQKAEEEYNKAMEELESERNR